MWTVLMVLSAAHSVSLAQPPPGGVDLFGTSRITIEQIQERFGDKIQEIRQCASHGMQCVAHNPSGADPGLQELEALEALQKALQTQVEAGIHQMGEFACVTITAQGYFEEGYPVYVTIDIVDARDRDARMDFLPAPTQTLADPDSLLALFEEYYRIGYVLASKDELNFANMKCPAHHCLWGFEHPALQKYEELFRTGARRNKDLLVRILREDRDENRRACAVFLLAHTQDAGELVQILLPAIRDPNSTVRNNAMRVLAWVAMGQKDVKIPIEPLLLALNYPNTTDRNKASAILAVLADRPEYRDALIHRAGPVLLKLLRLLQPNNHDHAYAILKTISGKDFGDRDYEAWEQWLKQQAQE